MAGGREQVGEGKRPRPLPEPLRRYVELVNQGEFWESHEALEGPWRKNRSDFYHGLILYASAFVHARRGTPHGIVAQLEKAEEALQPYPDAYLGLNVAAIRRHARRTRKAVSVRRGDGGEEEGVDWSAVVDDPVLHPDPNRVRGDEPELEESAD